MLVLERHSAFLIPNHMVWWFSYSVFYSFVRLEFIPIWMFFSILFRRRIFFSHLYAWKKRGIGFSYFPALFVCKELKFSSILDVTRTQLHLSKQFFVDWTYLFTGKRQRWNTDFLQFFFVASNVVVRDSFFNIKKVSRHAHGIPFARILRSLERTYASAGYKRLKNTNTLFGCSLHYD